MKVISKIAIVFALGLLVSAGLSTVQATCGVPGTTFGSFYFDAPIGQDPSATQGVFWGIGQFNPAHPGGTDNGSWASSGWLRYTPGQGFYIAGDWSSDAGIDGCIQDPPNPQPGKMGIAWTTGDGDDSYFVALCGAEDASGAYTDPISSIPSAPMARVPKPVIHASSRAGNVTNVTVGHEAVAGGVFNQGGCTLAITGFKVYQKTVARNGAAPTNRSPVAGGWTLLGSGSESTADVSGAVTCGVDSDIYLLTTLVLDGNVELPLGSRNSTRVECGPNLATPGDDNFHFIRKPKNAKGR